MTSRLYAIVPAKGRPVIGVGDAIGLGSVGLDADGDAETGDDEELAGWDGDAVPAQPASANARPAA
jgi:hypothetical protein